MPVKGTYLAVAGGGIILLWSGMKGKNWTSVLRNLIAGKKLSTTPTTLGIQGTPPALLGPTGGGVVTSGAIASDFETYVGKVPYKWAGANPQGWDCSGAFNYVANHDVGLPIPGYAPHTFTGKTHGPPTMVYWVWMRTHATKIPRQNVQADDVCLWMTHMGVAIDNKDYVSAYDTANGTCNRPIDTGGPTGETPTFWRL